MRVLGEYLETLIDALSMYENQYHAWIAARVPALLLLIFINYAATPKVPEVPDEEEIDDGKWEIIHWAARSSRPAYYAHLTL